MDHEFESVPSRTSNTLMVVGILIAFIATGTLVFGRALSEFVPIETLIVIIVGGDALAFVVAIFGLRKAYENQWLTLPKWHIAAFFLVTILQPFILTYMEIQASKEPPLPDIIVPGPDPNMFDDPFMDRLGQHSPPHTDAGTDASSQDADASTLPGQQNE
ncbi:MAG: hypothetical protein AAFS10_19735 [Myxococcota bacterium]